MVGVRYAPGSHWFFALWGCFIFGGLRVHRGWVKIYRSILTWEWYSDINVRVLFIHLLLKANHAPNRWQGIEIQAGQLVTSLSRLEHETGLSQKKIRNALKKLEKTGELGTQKGRAYTLITICNYARYQGGMAEEGTPKGKQRANKGQQLKNYKALEAHKEEYPEVFELAVFSKKYFDMKYIDCSLDTLDKLIRLDNYTVEQIKTAIVSGKSDSFWSQQFNTPNKLRGTDKYKVKYIDIFLKLSSDNKGDNLESFKKRNKLVR